MTKHKYTDKVCAIIITIAVILTGLIFLAKNNDLLKTKNNEPLYTKKIFKNNEMHTINVKVNESDWKTLLENATKKEYIKCDVAIDGEDIQNVGIRAKGNSSLKSVANSKSDRYSFKIEFNHYEKNCMYYGLDKLALNNIIQDDSYMKDFLAYTLMNKMNVAAPLCSYTKLLINGEEFGVYLAVEGIEKSFIQRKYGESVGCLYKPESAMGGGDMSKESSTKKRDTEMIIPEEPPEGELEELPKGPPEMNNAKDVALNYSDDNVENYKNIFDGAVWDVKEDDETRLIKSIKQLNEKENLENVVDIDEVARYFAVHNFVNNYDSYTSVLMHNYYLYEKKGKMLMIAWDYNLGFSCSGNMPMPMEKTDETNEVSSATKMINYPIDTPLLGAKMEERPMLSWIFSKEEYKELYHKYLKELVEECFDSGYCENLINSTKAMIEPYVKEDKTSFCTYEDFEDGVENLKKFCSYRAESVEKQVKGDIPTTEKGQEKTKENFVNADDIEEGKMNKFGPPKIKNEKSNELKNVKKQENEVEREEASDDVSSKKKMSSMKNKRIGQVKEEKEYKKTLGYGTYIICIGTLIIIIWFINGYKKK